MSLDLTSWETDRLMEALDAVNRCADALERIAAATEKQAQS